jgi:hypothetical protein
MLSTLLTIVLVGVVIGLALWLVTTFLPLDPRMKNAISGIAVAVFVIWALLVLLGHAPAITIRD